MMRKGINSTNDVKKNRFFTTNGRDVWKCQMFCDEPTVDMVNIETGAIMGGAVGCLNLAEFRPLIDSQVLDD